MEQDDPVAGLYARAEQAKVSMAAICREAGIAETTPSRWKNNRNGPTYQTIRKLDDALRRIVADRPEQLARAS